MRIKLLSLFILFLLLQGCSSNPSLERAVNFEKGISNIPEGSYLFLEFRADSVCSDECNCPPAPRAPLYEITSTGELWIENSLEGFPTSSSPIVGFFVFNDWGGRVYVMDTLPFALQPSDTTMAIVYSVNADGTAVVEVDGNSYFIKPGQSWTDSGDVWQPPPFGCHVSYSKGLTNFGLFSQTQIRFGYPNLHP
jgi:hypothetical protein